MLFSEFVEANASSFALPALKRRALVHVHCHQKSIMKMGTEEAVLQRMGVDYQMPAQGCCGMAGAFGFEKEKYDVSIAIGELELLPAVRNLSTESLIIADGFSCREQIEQCTGRHALHLAEVVHMGLRGEA
jgi:Fe-S oxidoreductase